MNKQQKELDRFFKKQKWPYWQPLVVLVRLLEEAGELARVVNHIYGPKKKKSSEDKQNLEDEIGDIIFTLACLANPLKINLDEAFQKSFDKVSKRDKNRFSDAELKKMRV